MILEANDFDGTKANDQFTALNQKTAKLVVLDKAPPNTTNVFEGSTKANGQFTTSKLSTTLRVVLLN